MTIYKYQLAIFGEVEVQMPKDARIMSVQVQNGIPCIWAMVDENAPEALRHFRIVGTGHPCNGIQAAWFIGTVQLDSGALVLHVFEEAPNVAVSAH